MDVQKFNEDSTIVYSIEEDDQDILTMTAIIGNTNFQKNLIFLSKMIMIWTFQKSSQKAFFLRGRRCLASVPKEDKWGFEGVAPRKKSKLRLLKKPFFHFTHFYTWGKTFGFPLFIVLHIFSFLSIYIIFPTYLFISSFWWKSPSFISAIVQNLKRNDNNTANDFYIAI